MPISLIHLAAHFINKIFEGNFLNTIIMPSEQKPAAPPTPRRVHAV